jgi:hypothetical protein
MHKDATLIKMRVTIMDIQLFFNTFCRKPQAFVGAALFALSAQAHSELTLKSDVRYAAELSAEEANFYGVSREKNHAMLFAQVVDNNDTTKSVHSQIHSGATCKQAGLLSLPLYRTKDGRMMTYFRYVAGDSCRFLIYANSGSSRIKSDFVYTFTN